MLVVFLNIQRRQPTALPPVTQPRRQDQDQRKNNQARNCTSTTTRQRLEKGPHNSNHNGERFNIEPVRRSAKRTLRLRPTAPTPSFAPHGRDFEVFTAFHLKPARPRRPGLSHFRDASPDSSARYGAKGTTPEHPSNGMTNPRRSIFPKARDETKLFSLWQLGDARSPSLSAHEL